MSAASSAWQLDSAVTFLNHGSFGACPTAVLEAQRSWRERLEREPVRFFVRELEPLWDSARQAVARFVGAEPAGLVFLPNATTAVNTALRSFPLASGDEVLVHDQAYNACANAVRRVAAERGATTTEVRVPFPLDSEQTIVEAFERAISPRTRLALVDHVASPTGLVFPLARIAAALRARGVEIIADGAHAPGMIPLALDELKVAYYAGNLHKWVCAPKGAGFLYVRADLRASTTPLVTSHGANSPRADRSRLWLEFDWTGTSDPTPFLCVPEALATLERLVPGGWPALMAHNHALALVARDLLVRALGVPPPCPDALVGAMAAVSLPDHAAPTAELDPLQEALWHEHRIEVPVVPWPRAPHRLLRVSAQLYNARSEYERLATCLRQALSLGSERCR